MPPFVRHHPAPAWAGATFLVLVGFYGAAGALWPRVLPSGAGSAREVIGMAWMLILMPTLLVGGAIRAQQHSLALVEQLRPDLGDTDLADRALAAIRGGLARTWKVGAPVGLVLGLLNSDIPGALAEAQAPAIDRSLTVGQWILWITVGLVMGTRIVTARTFRRLGGAVAIDLLRPDRLRPLARCGLPDLLLIAGAVALSPLQSLDAVFRWYNYHFAVIVAVPAVAFLLVWPLRDVHRRLREERARKLAEVDRLIDAAPAGAGSEDVARLEPLLAHRERLLAMNPWLLSSSLVSRVVLYLVIPPLAWIGAALVERFLDRWLGG